MEIFVITFGSLSDGKLDEPPYVMERGYRTFAEAEAEVMKCIEQHFDGDEEKPTLQVFVHPTDPRAQHQRSDFSYASWYAFTGSDANTRIEYHVDRVKLD